MEQDNAEITIADPDLRSGWCVEGGFMVKYVKKIHVGAELGKRYWQGLIRPSGQNVTDENRPM